MPFESSLSRPTSAAIAKRATLTSVLMVIQSGCHCLPLEVLRSFRHIEAIAILSWRQSAIHFSIILFNSIEGCVFPPDAFCSGRSFVMMIGVFHAAEPFAPAVESVEMVEIAEMVDEAVVNDYQSSEAENDA